MANRIVILGGGTGGTLAANRLQRTLGEHAQITVIDRDDHHVYQPGLLLLPFGEGDPHRLVRSRRAQLRPGISFQTGEVEQVDTQAGSVKLSDGGEVPYDVLVIASGARLLPEETEGLTGPGWQQRSFTFYTLEGAIGLRDALRDFQGGRLVVNVVDMPIKCPVAPLEFSFLADWYFRRRGIRERVEISFVTPLDGAFTKATCNRELSGLLEQKGISVTTEFNTGRVDGEAGRLVSWDEREIDFDLLVSVPLHGGFEYVSRSPGLGDDLGFVCVDRATLQAQVAPNVFALGDATDVPTSKAGSVAHFQGETLVENVRRFLAGEPLVPSFDGHTNCFIETGFHKALLIDFSYDVEPLPGRYPIPGVGPLPLLRQSYLNHAGKIGFQWLYWNVLLPGLDLPGVGSEFQIAGKDTTPISA